MLGILFFAGCLSNQATLIKSDNVKKLDFSMMVVIAFSYDLNEKKTSIFESYFTIFLRNLKDKKLYSFVVNPELNDKLYFYIGVPLIGPVKLGKTSLQKKSNF